MDIARLIEPVTGHGDALTLQGAEHWMQGRTLYGGASALIAYTAAIRGFPDLPPLRAAQIGFVAPVGEEIALRAEIVRHGRNVVQLRSEILCEGKVALTAFWLFGAGREANGRHKARPPAPPAGTPEDGLTVSTNGAPSFLEANFEVRHTSDRTEPGEARIRRWARLKEPSRLDPISELILMGDTLPPSAARVMERRGPISSINWSFNLLHPAPTTRGGWWMLESASDHADQGYSSERLRLWNADGEQMLAGMQSAAIFG